MRALAEREGLARYRPDLGTSPRIWYASLHRFRRCFIAGSVEHDEKGIEGDSGRYRVEVSRDGIKPKSVYLGSIAL